MLPRKHSLKEKDFSKIYRLGKYLRSNSLSIKFLPNSLGYHRCGVVISKKVSNKATQRNRLKRQILAIIADNFPKPGYFYDFVVLTNPTILSKEFLEIQNELIALLGKMK